MGIERTDEPIEYRQNHVKFLPELDISDNEIEIAVNPLEVDYIWHYTKYNNIIYVSIPNILISSVYNIFTQGVFNNQITDSSYFYYAGFYYYISGNEQLAHSIWNKCIGTYGISSHLFLIGIYHESISQNYNEALRYYKMDVSYGNGISANKLGSYFYSKQQNELAKYFFLIGVNKECVYSMHNLGNYYINVEANFSEAIRYYKMASDLGCEKSTELYNSLVNPTIINKFGRHIKQLCPHIIYESKPVVFIIAGVVGFIGGAMFRMFF
jgi:tetratricopeptide (TPR) repeat protein